MIYFLNGNQEVIKIVRSEAVISAIQTQEIPEDDSLLRDYLSVRLKNDERLFNAQYMAIKTHGGNRNAFDLYRIANELVPDNATEFMGIQVAPYELEGVVIEDLRPQNRPLNQTMNQVLEGTDWRLGYVSDNLPNVTTNFYYMSAKDALKKTQELTNVEMLFKVEISGNKITDKWVEVYHQLGNRTMKRFNYGTNALSVVRESSHDELYTALIGRGKGEEVGETESGDATHGRKINFADIEWKKSAGKPVDKPKGQKYIELPSATAEYGIKLLDGRKVPRIGIVEFSETDDPEKLIQETYQELLVRARPKVLFKASVINTGDMLIGDTVTIHKHDLDFHYQARVRKVVRDRKNNNKTQVEIGDVVHTPSTKRQGQINSALNNVASDLENVRGEITEARQSADGKNTNFYGNVEPDRKRVGDTWFRDHPSLTGESQILVWNGEAWELIMDTSETTKNADAIAEQQQDIEEAKQVADEAVEQIDTAVSNAGFTSLDETINSVQAISNQAQINASTAIDDAFEAMQQASQAVDNTGSLNVRVDEVENTLSVKADKQTVDDLTGVVDTQALAIQTNAQGLALKANQSTVDTLAGNVSSLGTDFDIVAGQVSSKVWNTDIETAIDGIEVGGRNLLLNSDSNLFGDGRCGTQLIDTYLGVKNVIEITSPQNTMYFTPAEKYSESLKAGEKYILSFLFTYEGSKGATPRIYLSKNTGGYQRVVGDIEEGKFNRVYVNINPTSDHGARIHMHLGGYGTAYIAGIKLEKGNKATDWTPALEDVDAQFDYIQTEWTQTFESFQSEVSDLEGRVTIQRQDISSIERTIQQVGTDLDNNVTLINQTIDTVDQHTSTIATLRTNVDGKVEMTEYNTLVNTVDRSIQRIGTAEGDITQLEATAQGLQTTVADKVSQAQLTVLAGQMRSEISDIVTGGEVGENYVTKEGWGHYWEYVTKPELIDGTLEFTLNNNSGWVAISLDTFTEELGETYTYSGYAKANGVPITTSDWKQITMNIDQKAPTNTMVNDETGRFVITQEINNDSSGWIIHGSLFNFPNGTKIEFEQFKIELGDEATEHSLSLQGLDNSIIANSSAISQNSSNINLRVTKGELLSQINIEAGRTLIQSDKILLNATNTVITGTTWLDGAVIANASIDGAKIQDATIGSAKIASLGVDKISGNRTEFIQSYWNRINDNLSINGSELAITAGNGWRSTNLTKRGIEYWWKGGLRAGAVGYFISHNDPSSTITGDDMGIRNDSQRHSIGVMANSAHTASLGYTNSTTSLNYYPAIEVIAGQQGDIVFHTAMKPSSDSTRKLKFEYRNMLGQFGLVLETDNLGSGIFFTENGMWFKEQSGRWSRFTTRNIEYEGWYGNSNLQGSSSGNFEINANNNLIITNKKSKRAIIIADNIDFYKPVNINGRTTYQMGDVYSNNGSIYNINYNRVLGIGSNVDLYTNISMKGNNLLRVGTIDYESDKQLKEKIKDRHTDDLNTIMSIRYVDYRKINNQQKQRGFIAQELQLIDRDLVIEGEDGILSYDGQGYVHTIGHAVQQLALKEENTNKIASQALQATETNAQRIERLEKEIQKLKEVA